MDKRRGFIALVGLLTALAASPSQAQTPVETFLQQSIDRGIAVLKNKSLSESARRQQLAAFLGQVLDTRRMAMFMLGDAKQNAAASDLEAYANVYKAFTIANYESQLSGYDGQTLKVTGSTERAPGDYIVDAELVDPAVANDPMPLTISFRVLDEAGGKFAVVDAGVAGIWLGLAQRADFAGYLSQHANNVPALTAHLQEMTVKLSEPGTSAAQ